MKISIISLFPSMFEGPFATSMLKKAQDEGLLSIELINLRDYGMGPRKTVDDSPYGGGAGMVLKPEPIFAALADIKKDSSNAYVVLMTPRGIQYKQHVVKQLTAHKHLVLICGHYEGVDERVMSEVDLEVSIGDFVLTGGELAAMIVVDSVARFIPGVLGHEDSAHEESFAQGLLEHPHYTRPNEFNGEKVPDELKTGNHSQIAGWRKAEAIKKTKQNRPDLLDF